MKAQVNFDSLGGGSNVVFQNGGSYGDIPTNGKPKRAIISFNYSTYLETVVYDSDNEGYVDLYVNGIAKRTYAIGASGAVIMSVTATGITLDPTLTSSTNVSYMVEI